MGDTAMWCVKAIDRELGADGRTVDHGIVAGFGGPGESHADARAWADRNELDYRRVGQSLVVVWLPESDA